MQSPLFKILYIECVWVCMSEYVSVYMWLCVKEYVCVSVYM